EDHLTDGGVTRHRPFFKPDWSPELLLSVNYLRRGVIRRTLVAEVGGFDMTMEAAGGAREWDLMLRCTEKTSRIHHLPQVLCHLRRDERAAPSPRCVAEHLRRQGITGAQATLDEAGRVAVSWPARGAKVSIIIPTKDQAQLLRKCLTSLDQLTGYRNFEV